VSGSSRWIGQLETEIARELGQPVRAVAGGRVPGPAATLIDVLEVPGARLLLAADCEETRTFLAAARLIEAGQADDATVRELWSGILSSVAARLGGHAAPGEPPARFPEDAFSLSLGEAVLAVGIDVTPRGPEETAASGRGGGNFDLLLEIELDAAVRFGSREMELRELMDLGPGDVVELDRHLSDPVDLIVGDKIVARGEVVLVNGNFGLRVTEVAEPTRRLESIRWLS
jgi:flagellar motor switch protein FliN